ncbi:hypothetical protein [Mycolicibacterium sp. CBMA 226]|uniref:hypothetical protein n=1 Tax=Mycolicibacterium sp. CBMA 226 TaxID=2606611 RepID=UPI0012DE5076|nr:hypothetical protein [Mycolicibacterium sp. CBMA 226]MUL78788.1 hypothetical protein [Mycolicibacterium sp. CBMA 226]QGW61080.1 hypothetical protein ICEMyc226_00048 [Mycolicibacterium sp.]
MGKTRTFRFHAKHGPALLFETAGDQLKALTGLNLEIPHAKLRFDEREIPLGFLTDFQPEDWELITAETAMQTGRITYMSLRRTLESEKYLWIVLAFEHVITAWITGSPSRRTTHPLIVKDGPVWDALADYMEPKKTKAMFEWEQAYIRRARGHQILAALTRLTERPNSDRLAHAAELAIAGSTWNEAAAIAGFVSRKSLDATSDHVLRAAKQNHAAGDSG